MAQSAFEVRHASDNDVTTVLGRQDRTRGDLHVGGGVRVQGVVRGNIEPVSDQCTVIVSEGGHVQGNVHASRARVDGAVTGALSIDGHLDVSATAVIDGDITYGSMSIESGARVDGHVRCRHSEFNERE
ncbi:MAG: polymer-forming cytoskeletal protein [Halofilum sp. (in: g-proteobacteria)]|nr:polymer-forming cytoskeletal protein [Halofilum sp. (in: g-proteobacteria)]